MKRAHRTISWSVLLFLSITAVIGVLALYLYDLIGIEGFHDVSLRLLAVVLGVALIAMCGASLSRLEDPNDKGL
jgi:cation transporter-like permease